MTPDVVIIGGGVAGLSCGCYLQMNGYRTEILEMNDGPGGLCVAWDRGAYRFDGCLRWLVGTNPNTFFYRIWHELGGISGREIHDQHEFLRVEGRGGEVLRVTADLDALARDCKQLSPSDASRIDALVRASRRCASLDAPEKAMELMNIFDKMRMVRQYLPMLWTVGSWMRRPVSKYAAGYHSPFLREVVLALAGHPRMSSLVLVMVLGWRSRRNAGSIVGGSRVFTEGVAARYQQLGGVFRFNAPVASITVENDRATGVRCADGTSIPAGTVVSCADAHNTIYNMLGGRYLTRQVRHLYGKCEVFPGLLQASFGIGITFPEAPHGLSFPIAAPLKVDDVTSHDRLEVGIFGADSGLCPEGKTIMLVRMFSRFEYWSRLRDNSPADYTEAKDKLLRDLVGILDRRFPGLAADVEESDLATPATFARFTGNWQGSFQGWLPTPRSLGHRLPRSLPGLKNFYLGGHWVDPGGGLPQAALSGRYIAQMVCARDGRKFSTSVA
ncbi:MAG TPA: NAD(P)/FAD-dependent oxidoreductase [Candidatus Acidoferrum sp.]|nr:NAD(P)/FAD-dependent oxidoreductase [Candidatus Acidoferrum sp.]